MTKRQKECEMEMLDLTKERCVCGHLLKNHRLIISKKVMKNKGQPVNGHCKFCKCRKMRIE